MRNAQSTEEHVRTGIPSFGGVENGSAKNCGMTEVFTILKFLHFFDAGGEM